MQQVRRAYQQFDTYLREHPVVYTVCLFFLPPSAVTATALLMGDSLHQALLSGAVFGVTYSVLQLFFYGWPPNKGR